MRHVAVPFAFALVLGCGGSTAPDSGDGGTDATTDGSVSPDLFACGGAGECDIRPQSCCGSCGSPTTTDMIAVNWQKGSAYGASVCGTNGGCPPCFNEPDPNLAPVCRSKTCKAVDVRVDDALSRCKVDQDCRLRFPGCCESCGGTAPERLIALSNGGATEYVANQCKPDAGGCPKCAVFYPPGYAAICNPTTLHCEVGKVVILDSGAD
jgi:hypothetical protein